MEGRGCRRRVAPRRPARQIGAPSTFITRSPNNADCRFLRLGRDQGSSIFAASILRILRDPRHLILAADATDSCGKSRPDPEAVTRSSRHRSLVFPIGLMECIDAAPCTVEAMADGPIFEPEEERAALYAMGDVA